MIYRKGRSYFSIAIIAFGLMGGFLFLFASTTAPLFQLHQNYTVDESLRLDISGAALYNLTLVTPSSNITQSGAGERISLKLAEAGLYTLYLTLDGDTTTHPFEVFPLESSTTTSTESTSTTMNASLLEPIKVDQPVRWRKQVLRAEGRFEDIPEYASDVRVVRENVDVHVDGIVEEMVEVEYTTPAPQMAERNVSRAQKEVMVWSVEEVHYEQVHASSQIEEITQRSDAIKVFWKEEKMYLPFEAADTNGNGLLDTVSWVIPHLSNQTFEISIEVLTVQSYPIVGGLWSVAFTTVGAANLSITPIDGTNWDLEGEQRDLVFLGLRCGNESVPYQWVNGSVFVENYSCDTQGEEISQVLTLGAHHLAFTFGEQTAFAHNLAGSIKLYFNDTAMNIASCPIMGRQLSDSIPNARIVQWPGEFDSGLPGNSDAGQWNAGTAAIGNTTSATEIANAATSVRNNASFGQGWIYDRDLKGYTIDASNWTFNVSIYWGQGAAADTNRYLARISVVNCSDNNFTLVQNLTGSRVTGATSTTGGQAGWYDSIVITQVASGNRQNISVQIPILTNYTFNTGEYLFVELGFGAGNDATDRTPGLEYNFNNTFVITSQIIDRTTPSINQVIPLNGSILNTDPTIFSCNISDTNSVKNLTILVWNASGSLNYTQSATISGTFNVSNFSATLVDGHYNWSCAGYDAESNLGFSSLNYTLHLDRVNPLLEYGAGVFVDGFNFSNSWIFVNVSITETNFANITYELHNTSGLVNRTTYTTLVTTINWTALSNELYSYNVTVKDIASNINSTSMRKILLDTLPPSLILAHPQNRNYTGTELTINYTIADVAVTTCWYTTTAGVENISLDACTNNTYSAAEGFTTLRMYANDSAGNLNGSSQVTFFVDSIAPVVTFVAPTPLNNSLRTGTSLFVNVSITETNFANITYELHNTSGLVNRTTYTTLVTTINWTGLNNNYTNYTYNASVRDILGTVGSTVTRHLTLIPQDTAPPDIFISSPAVAGMNVSNGNFTFNVSLSEEGNVCLYSLSNGVVNYTMSTANNISYGAMNTSISEGQYVVLFYCNDTLGNLGSRSRFFGIDVSAPFALSFITPTPLDGANSSSGSIIFNVSGTETNFGIGSARVQLANGGSFENVTMSCSIASSNFNCNYTYTNLADGRYNYTAHVNDSAGNSNTSVTRSVLIDTLIPLLDYAGGTTPHGINLSVGTIGINVSITETNFANITYELHNTSGLVNRTTYTTLVTTINWTALSDELYSFNVSIYDAAGNNNGTISRSVRIDRTSPLVVFEGGTAANGSAVERDWIFVNVSITETNFANITYELHNTSGLVNRTTYTTLVTTINWTGLTDENITYFYNVSGGDFANNYNSSGLRTIKLIDTIAPSLVLDEPLNTTYDSNESLSLSYTISDLHTGSCWYTLDAGANISLPSCVSTTFDVSEGQHTLALYANDSVGNLNSTMVTFIANQSLIITSGFVVQRGTATLTGNQNVTIAKSDKLKSLLLLSVSSATSTPNANQVTGKFVNSTMLRFENYAGGSASVSWELISSPALTVQRGESAYATGTAQINITIANVNLSAAVATVNNRLNSGTNNQYVRGLWAIRFLNSTAISLTRDQTGSDGNVSWQVVEWSGASVQNGTASLTGTSVTAGVASLLIPNQTFLLFSSRVSTSTGLDDLFAAGTVLNSSSIFFNRRSGGSGTMTIEWFALQAPEFYVQRSSVAMGAVNSLNTTLQPLINSSRSFHTHSLNSTGTGTTNANGLALGAITNTTNLEFRKGSTGQTNFISWEVIELMDRTNPIVTFAYPENGVNFTGFTIQQFNYTVNDSSHVLNCSLLGNWSGGFGINQTVSDPGLATPNNFSSVNVSADGFYIWNVDCIDIYGNRGRNNSNFTFGAFIQPLAPTLGNASTTLDDGTGSIVLAWNPVSNALFYRIYSSTNLSSNFTFVNNSLVPNYTDYSFAGSMRRFYSIESVNPTGSNRSSSFFGAHVYTLGHTSNTRNWISFPSSSNVMTNANETLYLIRNATAFSYWNETTQKRVTCNIFSCPPQLLCTDTNCNFDILGGRGYETNVNASAATTYNWSFVGVVRSPVQITLVKNASSFGKNWMAFGANTTFTNARAVLLNITRADAFSEWNAAVQLSRGLVRSPFPTVPFLGTNFSIEPERGYEISVNTTVNWTQA